MAIEPLSTTRRALLGAAAALPVLGLPKTVRAEPVEALPSVRGAALFTRRLARYRRLAAAARQAAETGFLHKANARYERDRAAIAARFGSWEAAIETPEGRTLRNTAFDRVNQAEETFYDRHTAPTMRAAILLAATRLRTSRPS